MNLLNLFKRKTVVRASTKEQRKAERLRRETHLKLADELKQSVQFRARMADAWPEAK